MDRLINENAVLSAIGEWIAHNEHTYTNATEYLRNRIKAIKIAEQEPTAKENLVVEQIKWERDVAIEQLKELGYGLGEKIRADEDCISRNAIIRTLNNMDRYIANELTLCDSDNKFPQNEVFIVDDVYEQIAEQLPPVTPQPNDKALKIISETMMDMFNNKPFEEVMGNLENNMREMGIEGIDFETVEKIIDKYKTESENKECGK